MSYNYSKLRGRIIEVCGTIGKFSKRMKLSETSISKKLNGKVDWTQSEIHRAMMELNILPDELMEYFFTINVQDI